MPIGIKFAAETPQEIAVSIIAKLIDVRNTGQPERIENNRYEECYKICS